MAINLPLAGLGLAANIAGSVMQRGEADKQAAAVADARNRVLQSYLKKQGDLSQEARGEIAGVLQKYAPGNTQLADAQGARTGVIMDTVGNTSDPNAVPLTREAPPAVRGEIAKRMLEAFNRSTTKAKTMGALGGYGDQWFNNNVDINAANRNIDMVNNFSRGNSSILQSQQDLAEAAAYKRPSIWGSVLSAGGNLALSAAGRGWGAGDGAADQAAAAFPRPFGR